MTTSLTQPTDSAPPNPLAGLFRSRKFLLMVLDVVASTILYFAAQNAGSNLDNIKFLIAAYQPVIIWVINSITVEDTARTRANAEVAVAAHEARANIAVAAHEARANIAVAEAGQPAPGTSKRDWPPSPWLPGGKIENRTNEQQLPPAG